MIIDPEKAKTSPTCPPADALGFLIFFYQNIRTSIEVYNTYICIVKKYRKNVCLILSSNIYNNIL